MSLCVDGSVFCVGGWERGFCRTFYSFWCSGCVSGIGWRLFFNFEVEFKLEGIGG